MMAVFTSGGIVIPKWNRMAGDYDIGESVSLNVDGTAREFLVIHHGRPSSLYDSSCEGTWLLMKDVYENKAWDSLYTTTKHPYPSSTIHPYLNGTFLGLFDSDIQAAIKQVKIPYSAYSSSDESTIYSGSSGVSTKVFLLGAYEIGADTLGSPYLNADGAKLDFFITGSTDAAKAQRIAYLNGEAASWFTRSPFVNFTSSSKPLMWLSDSSGNFNNTYASSESGIRPALIVPSTLRLSAYGNA